MGIREDSARVCEYAHARLLVDAMRCDDLIGELTAGFTLRERSKRAGLESKTFGRCLISGQVWGETVYTGKKNGTGEGKRQKIWPAHR